MSEGTWKNPGEADGYNNRASVFQKKRQLRINIDTIHVYIGVVALRLFFSRHLLPALVSYGTKLPEVITLK